MTNKTMEEQREILNTMSKQMAICGINQGYLDIRGLKYTMANLKNFELNLKFKKNLTISCRYNEGNDLYEVDCYKGTNKIYSEERIFCEDWKNVFDRIWIKLM